MIRGINYMNYIPIKNQQRKEKEEQYVIEEITKRLDYLAKEIAKLQNEKTELEQVYFRSVRQSKNLNLHKVC